MPVGSWLWEDSTILIMSLNLVMKCVSLLYTKTQFYPLYFVTCLCDMSKKRCVHNIKEAQLGHLCHRQKKKRNTGFRMCLKQIPQPNNKDGDSCCFKSTAAQRHGSPWKRKGMLAFQQNWGRLHWSLWQNQITTWRRTHWTNSALLEARYRIFPVKHWRTYH